MTLTDRLRIESCSSRVSAPFFGPFLDSIPCKRRPTWEFTYDLDGYR